MTLHIEMITTIRFTIDMGNFGFIECFTTTLLHTNWVEDKVGLKVKPEHTRYQIIH